MNAWLEQAAIPLLCCFVLLLPALAIAGARAERERLRRKLYYDILLRELNDLPSWKDIHRR